MSNQLHRGLIQGHWRAQCWYEARESFKKAYLPCKRTKRPPLLVHRSISIANPSRFFQRASLFSPLSKTARSSIHRTQSILRARVAFTRRRASFKRIAAQLIPGEDYARGRGRGARFKWRGMLSRRLSFSAKIKVFASVLRPCLFSQRSEPRFFCASSVALVSVAHLNRARSRTVCWR